MPETPDHLVERTLQRETAHPRARGRSGNGDARPDGRAVGVPPSRPPALVQMEEAHPSKAILGRDATFRRLLLVADLGAALAALALAAVATGQTLHWAALAVLPFIGLIGKLTDLYDRDELLLHKTTLDEAPRLFQMATVFSLFVWLLGPVVFAGYTRRAHVLVLWASLTVLLVVARSLARGLAHRLAPRERCLFVGDVDAAARVRAKLNNRGVTTEFVAQVNLDDVQPWAAHRVDPSRREDVRGLVRSLDIHRVILAPRSADGAEMLDLVRMLKAIGVRVSVVPRLFEAVGSSVEFDDLHGLTVLGIRRFSLTRSSRLLKRIFDLVSAVVVCVLVLPVMLAIAAAIKLDDGGPVFYRQARVGLRGRVFRMIKFRTMVPGAEAKRHLAGDNEAAAGFFKIEHDPRITRLGGFLRKSSLDELPQLLNVIRGQMSLVGPRPLVREEDALIEGWHRGRLELTPGMTGHWQLLGSSRIPLEEMVAIDYLYVANWTLWTDLKILLRTVPHVLARRSM